MSFVYLETLRKQAHEQPDQVSSASHSGMVCLERYRSQLPTSARTRFDQEMGHFAARQPAAAMDVRLAKISEVFAESLDDKGKDPPLHIILEVLKGFHT